MIPRSALTAGLFGFILMIASMINLYSGFQDSNLKAQLQDGGFMQAESQILLDKNKEVLMVSGL